MLLDLLLPRRCVLCARLGEVVCAGCAARLVPLGATGCRRCGAPGAWTVARCAECRGRRLAFACARGAIVYDAGARTLVSAWKEAGRRDLAVWAAGRVAAALPRPPVAAVVPVPGDRDRTLARGHVTARSLARELARLWDMPLLEPLSRTRRAERQRGLTAAERRRNVRGGFAARSPVPQEVCLVDDVYTTGSTANACATALRRGGAELVCVVTLARAVR